MSIEIKSFLWGIAFSLSHIFTISIILRYFKKITPIFAHAVSACVNLILLCLLSIIVVLNLWMAFSVLAFAVSSCLFAFGTVYKSIMIRILFFSTRSKEMTSVDELNEKIIAPTFTERSALLVNTGHVSLDGKQYTLSDRGKKTANFINGFRRYFNIRSNAMYKPESKEPIWKRFIWLRKPSKYMIFIVYFLLAALFISGLYQKLYKCADNRIKFHAVPIAISTLYQGHKHDYRGWLSTEKPFQGVPPGALQDSFIKQQIKAPVDPDQGHYYWIADDRGYADFVIASFVLFGPHVKSLYYFWFLILFISVTLFVYSFRKYAWAMAYLAFLLLGVHSAHSLLKLIDVAVPIFEPRYFDVLALIPTIHLIFVSVFIERKNFMKHLGPVLGQVAIFVFLYHARSSLGWEIVAVVFTSLFCILFWRKWNKISVPLGVAALLVLSCTVLLSGYKHLTYHPSYFKDKGSRTFWHNALMGLQIKAWPADSVCDLTAANRVLDYAKQFDCSPHIKNLTGQDLLNTLGNWGTANWTEYEYWAKKLYFSLFRENKLDMLRSYFFYKPLQVLKEAFVPKSNLYEEKTKFFKHKLPWNPMHIFYLIPFLFIVLPTGYSLYCHRRRLLGITLLVFFCGMIPPIAFYSDILTHGGVSTIAVVLLYLSILICSSFSVGIKNYYYKVKINESS